MPARRRVTNKSEPIAFACPSCGANYIIVTIVAPQCSHHNKFECVKCRALFPLAEGRISLEYILMAGDADE